MYVCIRIHGNTHLHTVPGVYNVNPVYIYGDVRRTKGFAFQSTIYPLRGSQSQRLRQLRFMMSPATRGECKINFPPSETLIAILYVLLYIVPYI